MITSSKLAQSGLNSVIKSTVVCIVQNKDLHVLKPVMHHRAAQGFCVNETKAVWKNIRVGVPPGWILDFKSVIANRLNCRIECLVLSVGATEKA